MKAANAVKAAKSANAGKAANARKAGNARGIRAENARKASRQATVIEP
jgi:hypothetical protein